MFSSISELYQSQKEKRSPPSQSSLKRRAVQDQQALGRYQSKLELDESRPSKVEVLEKRLQDIIPQRHQTIILEPILHQEEGLILCLN